MLGHFKCWVQIINKIFFLRLTRHGPPPPGGRRLLDLLTEGVVGGGHGYDPVGDHDLVLQGSVDWESPTKEHPRTGHEGVGRALVRGTVKRKGFINIR